MSKPTVKDRSGARSVSAVISNQPDYHFTNARARVCFGNVKEQVSYKQPIIDMWFPDKTTLATKTSDYSDAYMRALDKYLGKFFVVERKVDNKARSKLNEVSYGQEIGDARAIKVTADTSRIGGPIFLGIMNLYKAIGEHPYVPVTYSLLLEEYPKLKFYQRLVMAHYLAPADWVPYVKAHTNGQHSAFRKHWLVHIKDLRYAKMVEFWTDQGMFETDKALAVKQSYVVGNANTGTSNYHMLPSPFSDTTLRSMYYPHALEELNDKNVAYMLNNDVNKGKKGTSV